MRVSRGSRYVVALTPTGPVTAWIGLTMKDAGTRLQKNRCGDQATILLVEDEDAIRSMAKMFLERTVIPSSRRRADRMR